MVNAGPASGASEGESQQGEYVLSLGELLQVMWRRLWVIALTALTIAALAVGFSIFIQTPQYVASTKILIGQEQIEEGSGLGGEVQGLQDVTLTMAEAVATRSVVEGAVEREGLSASPENILDSLTSEQVPETQFIEVSYTDADPQRAQEIVNAVSLVFSERVTEVSPGASPVTATVWDEAQAPQDPVSPNPVRDGALALVAGAILGVGLAFLVERLDDSWRSPEEVEQISGVPTFGVIPEFKAAKNSAARGASAKGASAESEAAENVEKGSYS